MGNRSEQKRKRIEWDQHSNKFIRAFGGRMFAESPDLLNSKKKFPAFGKLRSLLIDSQLNSSTVFQDFMKMEFDANGVLLTGQTILRNSGTGKRDCRNLSLLKNAIGCREVDFSNPDLAMEVLASISDLDLRRILPCQFSKLRVNSDLYSGSASGFLNKALAPYRDMGIKRSKAFYYFILSAGIDRKDLTLEPEQLRELLDSSGFDFSKKSVYLHEFFKMKFHSSHLIGTGRCGNTITGQSILNRYGGGRCLGLTTRVMGNVLREAGYSLHDAAYVRQNLSSKKAIREILSSVKGQVDWAAMRYNEFKYFKFDSSIFKGIGVTWLNHTGDTTSRNMRRLLKKVGITNKPSKRWVNRVK